MWYGLLFSIGLLMPFLFFRTVLTYLSRHRSRHEYVRHGRKFHHLHFGMGILLIGIIGFLTIGVQNFSVLVTAIGLGMMLDDFIPSLYIPEPEPQTSDSYFSSFRSTLQLYGSIILVILLITYLLR